MVFFLLYQWSFSQTWTAKANLGGAARHTAVGFSIGTKGYIGTGFYMTSTPFYKRDFWEWDQATNTWTQKANFGGIARTGAVGFSIGSKGYIGMGWGGSYPKDFWEYNPTTNAWTPKANFPGAGREWAAGFSVGTKGYFGTGNAGASYTNDFWEWDQTTNTWAQKANFPGVVRFAAFGLSIGNKGYIGTGAFSAPAVLQQDFWEYDPPTNTWTQKANFPLAMAEGTAFCIGKYGYAGAGTTQIGSGSMANFWKYDPSSNSWSPIPNFGGGLREMAASFSIGCYGYLCSGFINDNITSYQKDLWEYYDPTDTTCGCRSTIAASNVSCNGGNNGSATVTASGGASPYTYNWLPAGGTNANANGLTAGIYTVVITDSVGCIQTKTVTITEPSVLTTTITSIAATCNDNNGSANVNASGGTPGYTYAWNTVPVQTTLNATGLAPGAYTITITDANGCTQTQSVSVTQTSGPIASASASPNIITIGASTTLTATGGGTYLWTPSTGLSCITCANPTATPLETTTYCVLVTDSNGCTGSACTTIEMLCGNIFIPNAFSPNGDAENELECVLGVNCVKTFYFVIFDRWGEKVFETTDQKICWDGTYKGKRLNTAVFVYYMEATTTNNTEIIEKGNISLIR